MAREIWVVERNDVGHFIGPFESEQAAETRRLQLLTPGNWHLRQIPADEGQEGR